MNAGSSLLCRHAHSVSLSKSASSTTHVFPLYYEPIIKRHLYRWANQRTIFGKPLNQQAVVRSKLATMIARVEACQNWLENVTYQMCNVRIGFRSAWSGTKVSLLSDVLCGTVR